MGRPLEVSEQMLLDFICERLVIPRNSQRKWAQITEQSSSLSLGKDGQALGSLVLGLKGTKTGARGHDISDGTEVKTCSRLDQLDTCRDCKTGVARHDDTCYSCGGSRIQRNNDSKWLFAMTSEAELDLLTTQVPRVALVVADYPNFEQSDWETLRYRVFEVPSSARHSNFKEIMSRYFYSEYSPKKVENNKGKIAPKNLFPDSYQFYMCNPLPIFQATVTNASTDPQTVIDFWVKPDVDRNSLVSEPMPARVARTELHDWVLSIPQEYFAKRFPSYERNALASMDLPLLIETVGFIEEEGRKYLSLRETRLPGQQHQYQRAMPIKSLQQRLQGKRNDG